MLADRTHVYTCKHHKWQSWRHYGCKIDVSGCRLKGGLFDYGYWDARKCPQYEPREEIHDERK